MQQDQAFSLRLNAITLTCPDISSMSSFINFLFDTQIEVCRGQHFFELAGQKFYLYEALVCKEDRPLLPFAQFRVTRHEELLNLQHRYEFFLYKFKQEYSKTDELGLKASRESVELLDPGLNLWHFAV